jgi:hypothetical protein
MGFAYDPGLRPAVVCFGHGNPLHDRALSASMAALG